MFLRKREDYAPESEDDWPTPSLKRAISRFDISGSDIDIDLWNCWDATEQGQAIDERSDTPKEPQVIQFAPDIHLLGSGLRNERVGPTWGGALVRVLRNEADDQRCLQYLYIYTRQKSVVSLFWMVILPIFMGLWGYFGVRLLNELPVELLTIIVFIPLVLVSATPHYLDWSNGRDFSFRSTTLVILYFLFEVPARFLPELPLVNVAIGGVCLAYWLLDKTDRTSTAHAMDYVPCFVWIRKDKEKDEWVPDGALWDHWHYATHRSGPAAFVASGREISEKDLASWRRAKEVKALVKNRRRVHLIIDNPWHSMALGEPPSRLLLLFSLILSFGSLALLSFLVYSGTYGQETALFTVLCYLFILGGYVLARYPTPLLVEEDLRNLTLPQSRLTLKKLRTLWNLVEREKEREFASLRRTLKRLKRVKPRKTKGKVDARLSIIFKIQNPFNMEEGFFDTFRDMPEHLYPLIKALKD